nr:site-specific integrase [Terriglobales bacterium]
SPSGDNSSWSSFAAGSILLRRITPLPRRDVGHYYSAVYTWGEVDRQHLRINTPDLKHRLTFADLAQHYTEHELSAEPDAVADCKAYTTIAAYQRALKLRLLPRWGRRLALDIQPLEIEQWLSSLKRELRLKNPTLDKTRRVMSLVYKHGQRHGIIPRDDAYNPLRFVRCKTTTDYEAIVITPEQAFMILVILPEPERTLTLPAASTGLRISECLGLQWQDVSFDDSRIYVRRTWTSAREGSPKSKASQAPVPMHSILAEFIRTWHERTPYSGERDWVFPSLKLKGKKPRSANMLVECHLRPAAVKAGIIAEDDDCRFGFHNLRHSLASFLVRSKTDPKTVQALLRHSDVKTTLQLYAHSISADRMVAQGEMLQAILGRANR